MKHIQESVNGLGAFALLSLFCFCSVLSAKAEFSEPPDLFLAPTERIIAHVAQHLTLHPKDAIAHYTLGRVCSIAYAENPPAIAATRYTDEETGPYKKKTYLKPYTDASSLRVPQKPKGEAVPSPIQLKYLAKAVEHFALATRLDKKNAIYWLGYGWVQEQAGLHAKDVKPTDGKKLFWEQREWEDRALFAYRKAYHLSLREDNEIRGTWVWVGTVSAEAGRNIVSIIEKHAPTPPEKQELEDIKKTLELQKNFRYVFTPIIIPLTKETSYATLTSPKSRVRFDFLADHSHTLWSWVTPKAGVLVWDPKRSGRITRGWQLFGSTTWFVFWRNGYEPLATLDDNGDGWLSGAEMKGLAIWQDRNSNGVSEPGEVTPIENTSIQRIAVRGYRGMNGVWRKSEGVQFKDGRYAPTYDWVAFAQEAGSSPHKTQQIVRGRRR